MLLSDYLNPSASGKAGEEAGDRLTPREREIVQLIAEAKTTKEIARALDITFKTVDTHRANRWMNRRTNCINATSTFFNRAPWPFASRPPRKAVFSTSTVRFCIYLDINAMRWWNIPPPSWGSMLPRKIGSGSWKSWRKSPRSVI